MLATHGGAVHPPGQFAVAWYSLQALVSFHGKTAVPAAVEQQLLLRWKRRRPIPDSWDTTRVATDGGQKPCEDL